jgi:DNA-binding NtrC family response regulator
MKIKVVVVDDDFSALTAIKNYCEKLELIVIAAYDSPAKFISELDLLKFDMAILDYSMPQYNGIQLAEILNSKNIPVIFVTGHRDEIAAKAWDLNCIACIEKPVNVEKIKTAISKYEKDGVTDAIIELEIYGGKIARIKISEIAHIGQCKNDTSGNDRTLVDLSGKEYRIVNKKLEDLIKHYTFYLDAH